MLGNTSIGIPFEDMEITALGNAGDPRRATKEMGENLFCFSPLTLPLSIPKGYPGERVRERGKLK